MTTPNITQMTVDPAEEARIDAMLAKSKRMLLAERTRQAPPPPSEVREGYRFTPEQIGKVRGRCERFLSVIQTGCQQHWSEERPAVGTQGPQVVSITQGGLEELAKSAPGRPIHCLRPRGDLRGGLNPRGLFPRFAVGVIEHAWPVRGGIAATLLIWKRAMLDDLRVLDARIRRPSRRSRA